MSAGASSNFRDRRAGACVGSGERTAVTEPPADFIAAVAELNARVRQRARRARVDAGRAMISGDREQLVRALQNTLDLLDAVVLDLTESRAESAAIYANDPVFHDAADEADDEAALDSE